MDPVLIQDIMVKDVLKADKSMPVIELAGLMNEYMIGATVIVDNKNFPIGIVSERDIIKSLVAYKEGITKKQAQDIMSSPVLYLKPEEDIESAVMLMALSRIRRIPIVRDGELAGIVSYRDLTNALRKSYHKLEQETEKLTEKANRDPLTGLYNKRYIQEQLHYHFELSKRSDNPMTIIMLDIDFFKKVNDTYGHQCGDYVLKVISSLFVRRSRAINIVGRYGGEEFIILGPIGDYKSSRYLAERLRKTVEKHNFNWDGNKIKITISAGVAVWNSGVSSVEQLVEMSDKALYTAKHEGRNKVVVYETDSNTET